MRNCPFQLILFLYWAIVLPRICYFDIYIYIYIYIYVCIYIYMYIYIWKNILNEYIYIYKCFVHLTFSNPACKFTRLSAHTYAIYMYAHTQQNYIYIYGVFHQRYIYIYIYIWKWIPCYVKAAESSNPKCVEVGYLTLKYKLINIILHLV